MTTGCNDTRMQRARDIIRPIIDGMKKYGNPCLIRLIVYPSGITHAVINDSIRRLDTFVIFSIND